ncbi:unnamed protein product [Acanthoscelides obtectus]|uniref:Uncharacterized protein n=1 Tax=Acanthoscelides obtectus TaxID=200917 RepID=A0A9P0KGM1_ACAOB|nr:unnamed protein product [Acanthoscelides obtectus]CAK1625649.1 hypothetical protein AOBTE_LOCUS3306 [Acanthoscelides obtectus]
MKCRIPNLSLWYCFLPFRSHRFNVKKLVLIVDHPTSHH